MSVGVPAEGVPDELERAWCDSDRLFELFAPQAMHEAAIPLRHPPIFYVGHLPAFAWAQVGVGMLGEPPVDAHLDALFVRGIDPDTPPEHRPTFGSLSQVVTYRDRVRARLRQVAPRVAALPAGPPAQGAWVWDLVIEHERMHHETLLYLAHQVDPRWLRSAAGAWRCRPGPEPRPARWVVVRAGPAPIGTTQTHRFSWDIERPATRVEVGAFELEDLPVTVARFSAFIDDEGYARRDLWTEPAWAWREAQRVGHPRSWRRGPSGFEVRSLTAWHPLAEVAGWPVWCTHAEASAFARWSRARLPTEAELQRATYVAPSGEQRDWPWGAEWEPASANLGLQLGGLEPVGARREGAGPWGHLDLLGGLWAWTDTPLEGLPGFKADLPSYPGYSADFFDGEHRVVQGASWATSPRLARPGFRNWYRWNYPYALVGVRLARGA